MFKLKVNICIIMCYFIAIKSTFCQGKADTSFIKGYTQKIQITGYLSRNSIEIDQDDKYYRPNSTLRVGLGVSVKNTIINLSGDVGLVRLGSDKHGNTNRSISRYSITTGIFCWIYFISSFVVFIRVIRISYFILICLSVNRRRRNLPFKWQ